MVDDTIDFGAVKEELSESEYFHTFQILKRSSKWSAHDQIPVVFIITEKCIYYGGVEPSRRFFRIYTNDILDVNVTGPLFFKSIMVKFMYNGKKKSVYFCPFTGPAEKPHIDTEQMNELKELLSKYIRK